MVKFCIILLIQCLVIAKSTAKLWNYVCTNYDSYLTDVTRNKNCYYQSDMFKNTPELLSKYVGVYENHTVTTEDGYILHIFRIPVKNPKAVVMLQHPIVTDSVTWIVQGNESLAYLLWQDGYEVWLPNHRGTYFSRKHISMKDSDYDYWDFSYHEIGVYDYSAFIKYIADVTKRNDITFIGHSMSGTASIIYAAEKPDEAKKFLKIIIPMAPAIYFTNPMWLTQFVARQRNVFMELLAFGRVGSLLSYNSNESFLLRALVLQIKRKSIFPFLLSLFLGWSPFELDPKLLPTVVSMSPRAFSWKIFFHYWQWILPGGRFNWFDYGEEGNMRRYNSTTPPDFFPDNISVPVFLISSKKDTLTSAKDIDLLYNNLPERAKIYGRLVLTGVNHIDYQYGHFETRNQKIYKPIFNLLKQIYL